MDEMKFETALSTSSKNGHICEAEEGHVDEESWEEEINPLGLLDLVYVEENKEDENCNNTTVPSTSSTSDLVSHLNLETLDSDADDDEGEELEPVAAVDVSPVREEDFLPEGMNEDVLSSTRSTYLTSRASNPDTDHHQGSVQECLLVSTEKTLQRTWLPPQHNWNVQWNQLNGTQHPNQHPWEFSHQWNAQYNESSNVKHHSSISEKLHQQQEEAKFARLLTRREYYRRYRQKNPELVRIRNREYARRYRQTHADRVRERQREYIKRYRERKKLVQDDAMSSSEQSNAIVGGNCREKADIQICSESKENKSDVENEQIEQKMTIALNSKCELQKVVNEICEQEEVVVLKLVEK